MAASNNAAHVAHEVLGHKYVKRVIEDPEIRENARVAYASAREAYERLHGAKQPVSALLDDKKVQDSLKTAAAAFIGARAGLLAAPTKRKKRRWGRNLMILVAGGVLAIALSEGLRNKVLDLLFGAEEEFDYVSTTAPPAPEPVASAEPPAEAESGPDAEQTAEFEEVEEG